MGQIYLELKNYHEALTACHSCLCVNNQYIEGISILEELLQTPLLEVLKYVVPTIIKLGYRELLPQLDESVLSPEFLKKQRYVSYSEIFQDFLEKTPSENIIAIYGQIPKCNRCKEILRVYGERVNLKSGYRTLFYQCDKCGGKVEEIHKERVPYIRIQVVVKSISKIPSNERCIIANNAYKIHSISIEERQVVHV